MCEGVGGQPQPRGVHGWMNNILFVRIQIIAYNAEVRRPTCTQLCDIAAQARVQGADVDVRGERSAEGSTDVGEEEGGAGGECRGGGGV
jgi:hypothetical protein